jgi:hypothetical protein
MIDFVLKQFGNVAKLSSPNLVRFPLQVLVLHSDFAVPLNLHKDGQETEAGIPHDDTFCAALDNFWIHEGPRVFARQAQKDNALQNSNLRRGDAPPIAGGFAPIRQRVLQVFDERANFGGGRVLHRAAFLAQNGIPKLPNRPDRHGRHLHRA